MIRLLKVSLFCLPPSSSLLVCSLREIEKRKLNVCLSNSNGRVFISSDSMSKKWNPGKEKEQNWKINRAHEFTSAMKNIQCNQLLLVIAFNLERQR